MKNHHTSLLEGANAATEEATIAKMTAENFMIVNLYRLVTTIAIWRKML
jgi:hypothetical protein